MSSCTTEDRELVPGTKIARSRASRVRAAVLILVHVAIAAHIAHRYATGETMTPPARRCCTPWRMAGGS